MGGIDPHVADLYAKFDAAVEQGFKEHHLPVSCKVGCAHCCYQLVGVGISEALYIASAIAEQDNWREWAKRLFDAAREMGACTDMVDWFNRHRPCVFLDLRANLCLIYERRPTACRYHFVRTPAENCALGAENPGTERYNFEEVVARELGKLDLALLRENPAAMPYSLGNLPQLVLAALGPVLSSPGDRRFVAKRIEKLPPPLSWVRAYQATRQRARKEEVVHVSGPMRLGEAR